MKKKPAPKESEVFITALADNLNVVVDIPVLDL
jgi:hypothetical protein